MVGRRLLWRLLPSGVRHSLISGQYAKLRDESGLRMLANYGMKRAPYELNALSGYAYWRPGSSTPKPKSTGSSEKRRVTGTDA